jgi:hypothetical protein
MPSTKRTTMKVPMCPQREVVVAKSKAHQKRSFPLRNLKALPWVQTIISNGNALFLEETTKQRTNICKTTWMNFAAKLIGDILGGICLTD